MLTTIDLRELPARLSEALAIVLLGKNATPLAKLVPCAEQTARIPGLHVGAFQPSPDIDAPLPEDFWVLELS